MKTKEIPLPLRGFYKLFSKLEYRHDYVTVFDDLLTAMINFFTPPGFPPEDVNCFKKYKDEERELFKPMIYEMISVYNSHITTDTDWYDPFGDFYQMLASRGKQSSLGQFFTPSTVVDMMTKMQGTKEELTNKQLRVNDPTCGSGRFLIAFHANFPGNYVYGEDIDRMCCKMATINLMIHGCEGEVVNKDSLVVHDFRKGWQINSTLRQTSFPSIIPLEKEQAFSWRQQPEPPPLPSNQDNTIRTVGVQMGIFT
ncbi:MAG TPA: N-6 DNA methylase [Cyclobacteriaceae bacterium]|nr:N-6 DNA methylase [Cyclobacteriaceae bacterium]